MSDSDLRLAIYCLCQANWKDGLFQGAEIPRGSFATSIDSICRDLGKTATPKKVRGGLARLERDNFIQVSAKRGIRFTVITVVNYEAFQDEDDEKGEQRANKGRTKGDNRRREEGKKETMSEVETPDRKSPSKPKPPPPEQAIRCASYLQRHIVKMDPGHRLAKTFTDSQRTKWAATLELAHRIDGRSWGEIKATIEWLHSNRDRVQRGGFVVFSAQALREKFDSIRAARNRDQTANLPAGTIAAAPKKLKPSEIDAARRAAEEQA